LSHCEKPVTNFALSDQLVPLLIGDCEQVFTWVEGKRARLSADALWRRGRLIMLRTCNELLRRLSKTHDTVLRGRVLLLLSSLYSLSVGRRTLTPHRCP
jgi:THO complex subunit 1